LPLRVRGNRPAIREKSKGTGMKRFQAMCLAAVTVLAGAASAQAAVFDEVPSDALAVFEVKNIDQLNTKWNKFADATGLTQAAPNVKDPINTIEAQAGVTKGVNSAGDLAAVFFQSGDHKPKGILLVPVSDYKAFVGNFTNPQEGADGITAAQDKDGKDNFIAHWGDYAAVSSDKEVLANKPTGVKLTGIAADALAAKDAILWMNMDQIRSEELPKLKQNRDQLIKKMLDRPGNPNQEMTKVIWNVVFDEAEEFIQDSKNAVITLNLDDDGVALGTEADFNPDTPFSQFAAAMKGTDQPMLTGLPDKKYLMLVGEVLPPELKKQIHAAIDPVLKKIQDEDPNDKALSDMLASSKAKLDTIDAIAAGAVVPAGNPGQESMIQAILTMSGDAAAWKKAEIAALQSWGQVGGNAADANAPVTFSTKVKPQATTVGDVPLDQFTVNVDFTANDARAMQGRQALMMVFGPGGLKGYIGAVTDKVGLLAVGIDDQSALLADAIASAKSGKDVLSSAKVIQDVSAKLPSPRMAEGFVFIDQMLSMGMHIAQSFGLGVHVNVPADVDPLGVAISSDGGTIHTDAFIPQSLVKAVVGVVNDLHGPGAGGPGGPGPGGQGL
jgi:hypothetical protein